MASTNNGGTAKSSKSSGKVVTKAKPAAKAAEQAPAKEKTPPKYLEQQANRSRFLFGPVWTQAVIDGKVKDKIKLVAHGVFIHAGTEEELDAMEMPALIEKVKKALTSKKH